MTPARRVWLRVLGHWFLGRATARRLLASLLRSIRDFLRATDEPASAAAKASAVLAYMVRTIACAVFIIWALGWLAIPVKWTYVAGGCLASEITVQACNYAFRR